MTHCQSVRYNLSELKTHFYKLYKLIKFELFCLHTIVVWKLQKYKFTENLKSQYVLIKFCTKRVVKLFFTYIVFSNSRNPHKYFVYLL